MNVYLDASALVRLVLNEPEQPALHRWLAEHQGARLATNVIGAVEAQRAAGRGSVAERGAMAALLRQLVWLDVTPAARAVAAVLQPAEIRTLDALHVASASELAPLTALVTYDERTARAAVAYGLRVASPT